MKDLTKTEKEIVFEAKGATLNYLLDQIALGTKSEIKIAINEMGLSIEDSKNLNWNLMEEAIIEELNPIQEMYSEWIKKSKPAKNYNENLQNSKNNLF